MKVEIKGEISPYSKILLVIINVLHFLPKTVSSGYRITENI